MNRWVVLLLAFAAVLKIVTSAGAGELGTDGSYYTGIAQHVRDGEGLTTRVSLFHHGYRTFPHASPVYPVWPWVLGQAGRVVELSRAAVWLPTFFWFTAVAFAWLWARGLPRAPLFAGIDTADATALLVAFNVPLFHKTSLPYTEGLAYTLLFACLWRSHVLFARRGVLAGFELGAWIALIFLTRSQLVLVGMAAACAFAWGTAALPDRRRTVAMAIGCAASAVALVLPHWLHLREITIHPGVGMLRFEVAQANALLAPVDVLTDTHGFLAVLLDRLSGLPIAFSLTHDYAYMRVFFGLQYALFAAIPFFVDRVRPRDALAWLRDPKNLPLVFLLFLAAGGLASIHLVHKDFGAEWHFGRRHALTAFFAFHLAWLWLFLSRRPVARGLGTAILAGSLVCGGAQILRFAARAAVHADVEPSRDRLVEYLIDRGDCDGGITVAMAGEAQKLALRTGDAVSYHWLHEGTTVADLDVMFGTLGARLLLVQHDEEKPHDWTFLREPAFAAHYRSRADFDGYWIFESRGGVLRPLPGEPLAGTN